MEIIKKIDIVLVFRKKLPQYNSIEEIFHGLYENLHKRINVKSVELHRSGASFAAILNNMLQLRNISCRAIHITGDVHYAGLLSFKPVILTIHDIGSILNGNGLKQFFLKVIWFWLPALCVRKITVISNFSKTELCKIIPFAEKKIKVIPNPVSPILEYQVKNFNTEKPVILHIGTKPNKNLERTIEALSTINCTLIIIGKLSSDQVELLEINNIEYLNEYHISYNRVKFLYEGCDIVSFVSLYEGFGMPIIEAQRIGRPVITSNITSMPEVAGLGAMLVDPLDVNQMRRGYVRIINDKDFRKNLIKKGCLNAERFNINRIADLYLNLYNEILA